MHTSLTKLDTAGGGFSEVSDDGELWLFIRKYIILDHVLG